MDRESFWKEKSKLPYQWSNTNFHWISFVGYEIRYDLSIRVRKKSLEKEMEKQFDVIDKVRIAIGRNCRKNAKGIEESAINRLIGMSVGKIKLWNYKEAKNEMCWTAGFPEVNDNKYSRLQMRRLDSCRNRLIRKLVKELRVMPALKDKTKKVANRPIVYYGKPFSYYYHMIEKKTGNN